MLPASNKGYKLLQLMAWDEYEAPGLGVEHDGRVQPVKTQLRDRSGIGVAGMAPPRVTHFPSHVEGKQHKQHPKRPPQQQPNSRAHRQARRAAKASSKKRAELKDKRLRMELYSTLSEKDEALLLGTL